MTHGSRSRQTSGKPGPHRRIGEIPEPHVRAGIRISPKVDDRLLVQLEPLGLLPVNRVVVEGEDAAFERGAVGAEGSAGVEVRVVAVLDRGFNVLGAQVQAVVLARQVEPRIDRPEEIPPPDIVPRGRACCSRHGTASGRGVFHRGACR